MKKVYFLLTMLLVFPLVVHAEILTYNVCESGCEYRTPSEVQNNINLEVEGDLSDKDIIINIMSDYDSYYLNLGTKNNMINSLTINGNNHTISQIQAYVNTVKIDGLVLTRYKSNFFNSQKVTISNSNIKLLGVFFTNIDQVYNINELVEIDDTTFNNISTFAYTGNIKIENMNFKNKVVANAGGKLNITNCQISKIVNVPEQLTKVETNVYNSTFDSLKYKNVTTEQEANELENYFHDFNLSYLNEDIYDLFSNTTIFFDKDIELKLNDKNKLTEYLDYYTDDKEIEYTIEDETIAKMEGLTLTGLKEGQTNITVTTDDGHVVYRIKLNVIKETLAEKIDDMTIEIPITGRKIKVWALAIIIVLFGIIVIVIYELIKRKRK